MGSRLGLHPIHYRSSLEEGKEVALCHGLCVLAHLHAILPPDGGRDGRIDQIVQALEACSSHHGVNLSTCGAIVARNKAARAVGRQ